MLQRPPHPDAEALAIFCILRPWIGKSLTLTRGVSLEFADLLKKIFSIDIRPVDREVSPRPRGSTPVLSYSAGFDSTAASALLPEIPHLHHRRVSHPTIPDSGRYRADAIERLALEAGARGRAVYVTRADFEHLVAPFPSLPHWFGFAVGPLLMADHFDAGALVLGGTLETWYMDMGRRWKGAPRKGSGIDPLPELVGLPIMRPLVGITEVGTMRLTIGSELSDLARSCVSGTLDEACHLCAKCIRKDMLRAVVAGDTGAMAALPKAAPGWKPYDSPPPYYMQAQLEYAAARIPDALHPPALVAAVEKIGGVAPSATSWMEGAYRPAIEYGVPDEWRQTVEHRIAARLDWMSDDDVAAMQAWDRAAPAPALPAG